METNLWFNRLSRESEEDQIWIKLTKSSNNLWQTKVCNKSNKFNSSLHKLKKFQVLKPVILNRKLKQALKKITTIW